MAGKLNKNALIRLGFSNEDITLSQLALKGESVNPPVSPADTKRILETTNILETAQRIRDLLKTPGNEVQVSRLIQAMPPEQRNVLQSAISDAAASLIGKRKTN